MDDYYAILGVSRTASKDELKSAYRKLAVQYHPDKNQGNKEYEKKFKEIGEAYEVLKDDQKRAAYDQYGHAAFKQSGGGGAGGPFGSNSSQGFGGFDFNSAGGFSDIFEDLFGTMGGTGQSSSKRSAQTRGADLRYNMQVTLEEAYKGKAEKITFSAATACKACNGSGSKDKTRTSCNTCAGRGKVRTQQGFFTIERPCGSCQGEGQIIKNPCGSCNGRGKVKQERVLSVNIPQGVEEGTRIRLAGEGEPGSNGGPPGDLYIFMSVKPHKIFIRDGHDLNCKATIKLATAALGGEIEVPSIDGSKIKLSIPSGTQSEDKFRLKHKGMRKLRSTACGDMYVHVHVETPINLSKKQKDLLEEFDKETNEKSSPESWNFFKKVSDFFN